MEKLFDEYEIDAEIKKEFFSTFEAKDYPLIQIISDDNYEEIFKDIPEQGSIIYNKTFSDELIKLVPGAWEKIV